MLFRFEYELLRHLIDGAGVWRIQERNQTILECIIRGDKLPSQRPDLNRIGMATAPATR
jgi:hypothetical protein